MKIILKVLLNTAFVITGALCIAAIGITLSDSVGCSATQKTIEVGTKQATKAAHCIELGEKCAELAVSYIRAPEYGDRSNTFALLEQCLGMLDNYGCPQIAKELLDGAEIDR